MNEFEKLMLLNYSMIRGYYNPTDYSAKIFDTPVVNDNGIKNLSLILPKDDTTPIKEDSKIPWGLVASLGAANIGGFIGGMSPDYNSSNLAGIAGNGLSSVMGMNYTTLNTVDRNAIMKEYDNNTTSQFLSGNILGGVSRLLWGRNKQKAAIEQLHLQAIRTNDYNRDMTMTDAMQLNFMKKYGNPENLVLFARGGKDETPADATPVMVANNEIKVREDNTMAPPYKGGIKNKDSILDFVGSKEAIFTGLGGIADAANNLYNRIHKNTGSNLSIAENVGKRAVKELKGVLKLAHATGSIPEGQYGKAWGGLDALGNIINTVGGIGYGLYQALNAKNSNIYAPDTTVKNPSLGRIKDLYGLKVNMLPIINQQRDAEARAKTQIAQSGYTQGQRGLLYSTLAANTQDSIARAIAAGQDRLNALTAQAITTDINANQHLADLDSLNKRWAAEMYARGGSAQNEQYFSGLSTALGAFGHGVAQENKRRLQKYALSRYDTDILKDSNFIKGLFG